MPLYLCVLMLCYTFMNFKPEKENVILDSVFYTIKDISAWEIHKNTFKAQWA